jgi:hypothetical protein
MSFDHICLVGIVTFLLLRAKSDYAMTKQSNCVFVFFVHEICAAFTAWMDV